MKMHKGISCVKMRPKCLLVRPTDKEESTQSRKWNTDFWLAQEGGGVEHSIHFRLWMASQSLIGCMVVDSNRWTTTNIDFHSPSESESRAMLEILPNALRRDRSAPGSRVAGLSAFAAHLRRSGGPRPARDAQRWQLSRLFLSLNKDE